MKSAVYYKDPFNHWIIDDFFDLETATTLARDFYNFDDERWLTRNHTEFEQKRLSTHWDWYPKSIYSVFYYLCSQEFIDYLEKVSGITGLKADYGLHAGGMHIHGSNSGRLNLHQDAELHPKLGLKRMLNLIVYLNPDWEPDWGGELELWSSDAGEPKEKVKSISPLFNRAVLFETPNSWHGLPETLKSPKDQHRKSIALFYYIKPELADLNKRTRAMFAPTEDQKDDPEIMEIIHDRLKKEATWDGQ